VKTLDLKALTFLPGVFLRKIQYSRKTFLIYSQEKGSPLFQITDLLIFDEKLYSLDYWIERCGSGGFGILG
jgi:hypothetical protein